MNNTFFKYDSYLSMNQNLLYSYPHLEKNLAKDSLLNLGFILMYESY
jgi:hypothetical protein